MSNKTLRDLKEGDRFRFPGDPETRVRTLSQKGKVEGYCPYDGQNTMGHSKEGGEEVYLLGTKVVPIGNKEYANNKTLAARIGNEVFPLNEQLTHVYYCGYWEEIYLDSVKAPYIHPPFLDIVHITIVPAENKVENDNELKCSAGEWDNNLNDGNVYCGGIVIANCYSSLLMPATIKANAKMMTASKDLYEGHQKHMIEANNILHKWATSETVTEKELRTFIGAIAENSALLMAKANPDYKP